MSKIGRMPIETMGLKVEIKGNEVHCITSKGPMVYVLPPELKVMLSEDGGQILLSMKEKSRDANRIWGLHRALLANKIYGQVKGFETNMIINGLGYKAKVAGSKVEFALGFSHKINFDLPEGVSLEADKSGQKLLVKSADKALLGQVCSQIRSLRPPEPYKGKGIRLATEVVRRKVGKAKT